MLRAGVPELSSMQDVQSTFLVNLQNEANTFRKLVDRKLCFTKDEVSS